MKHVRPPSRRRSELFAAAVVWAVALLGPATLGRGDDRSLHVAKLAHGLRVILDGRPVLEYRSARDAYKAYVAELYTPSGAQVLRDSPADHVHHHGLMFALGVNEVNFWEERANAAGLAAVGRQRGGEIKCRAESNIQGAPSLVLTQALEWVDEEGRTLLQERRQLAVRQLCATQLICLNWNSRLSPATNEVSVVLRGQRYYGLGMRFTKEMDERGMFLFASDRSGDPAETNENVIRASWCAYTANASGKPVTVAMFSNPASRPHAARWFTMREPFAYLAATIGLDQRPLKLLEDEPLELLYGVVMMDGKLGEASIERLYQAWLQQD